jgi:hypothetical protein
MAGVTAGSTGDTPVRPLTIEIPEADLADLRSRLAATRRPDQETVADPSHGVQLATMRRRTRSRSAGCAVQSGPTW